MRPNPRCLALALVPLLLPSSGLSDDDRRPHVVLVIAEDEYETEKTLPVFVEKHLSRDYRVTTVLGNPNDRHDLPGLETLDEADLALISVRRRAPKTGQLNAVRRFVAAGKPVVGIRTASHAFALRPNEQVPEGHDVWPTFDPDVLGGHYTGHHKEGPAVQLRAASAESAHPVLSGVDLGRLVGRGSLYKVSPLASGTTPLILGTIPDQPTEPVAWTFLRKDGGRTFYTSLGHKGDFEQPAFQRLLRNAVSWGLKREGSSSR